MIADEFFAIYLRIRSSGLRSYGPFLVLPLRANHRRHRSDWCMERHQWDEEWNHNVFSDESRFCLSMQDGPVLIKRQRGERRGPRFVVESYVHNTMNLMVWGIIAYSSKTHFVFIRANKTSHWYVATQISRPSPNRCYDASIRVLIKEGVRFIINF